MSTSEPIKSRSKSAHTKPSKAIDSLDRIDAKSSRDEAKYKQLVEETAGGETDTLTRPRTQNFESEATISVRKCLGTFIWSRALMRRGAAGVLSAFFEPQFCIASPNPTHPRLKMVAPTTESVHEAVAQLTRKRGSNNGAVKDVTELLLATSPLRHPARLPGGWRLMLALASLCMVLWILAGMHFVSKGKTTSNTMLSKQVLLANPKLRAEEEQQSTQHSLESDSSSSSDKSSPSEQVTPATSSSHTEDPSATQQHSPESNSTATQVQLCEKIDLGHVEREFYNPESCFSRSDIQQIILGLVWTLTEVLTRYDIPYWLDSGTLLGSYREKTVIPHDVDADIGISQTSFVQLRDNNLEFPSEYEMHVLGSNFYRQGTRFTGLPTRLVHKDSGIYTDIFVFLDDKKDPKIFGPEPSNCFHGCHRCHLLPWGKTQFKIPREWVYPLQECTFGGHNVTCPAKPELYLDHMYGPNFATPDKKAH